MGSCADGDTSSSERRAHDPAAPPNLNHDPAVLIYSLNRRAVYTPSLQAPGRPRALLAASSPVRGEAPHSPASVEASRDDGEMALLPS
eukprot:8988949-Alexandrium_andersonii.AAC.1